MCNTSPRGWESDRSGPACDDSSKLRCIAFLPGWWNQNIRGGNQEIHALLLHENASACFKRTETHWGKRFSVLFSPVHAPQSLILFAFQTQGAACSWGVINYDTLILKQGWKIIPAAVRLFVQLLKCPHWPLWACIQITVPFWLGLPRLDTPIKHTQPAEPINRLHGSWSKT